MELLNIGCGARYHKDWINIDKISYGKDIIQCDLKKGIPFPDSFFNVVYHSNLIEHFSKKDAEYLIQECFRVLIPGGIIRIATPDLEEITNLYLESLKKAREGLKEWVENYEWILLEMYDQTVRNVSGGEMLNYFLKDKITNKEFILKRCGVEAKNLIEYGRKILKEKNNNDEVSSKSNYHFLMRVKSKFFSLISKNNLKELFIRKILKDDYEALKIGRFRLSGEVHQWMYDNYSLSVLLSKCGFINIIQRDAFDSYVKNWPDYNLDTEENGEIYKPDSFYMEAIRPFK